MKKTILIGLFAFVLLYACNKSNDESYEINSVSYGTSFGECVGYCRNEITLQSGSLVLVSSGWFDTIPEIKHSYNLDNSEWISIKNKIETSSFFKLKSTYGCPDCADGGAEWIEVITTSGKTFKVNFEFMNEPEELKNIAPTLRLKMPKTN